MRELIVEDLARAIRVQTILGACKAPFYPEVDGTEAQFARGRTPDYDLSRRWYETQTGRKL
jgi:hypothetical protein